MDAVGVFLGYVRRPFMEAELMRQRRLSEDDQSRFGGEKAPGGLGSRPWKSQSNDPLRDGYIIQQTD